MKEKDQNYWGYVNLLKEELIPAMGCTEPIALAYAAAKARELLGELPESVLVEASGSIIKNVKSVIVPNTGNLYGIQAAAVAGIVAGQSDLVLQVLSRTTEDQIREIHEYLKQDPVRLIPMVDGHLFDIRVSVKAGQHQAVVRISDTHTNIVYLEKDGEVLLDKQEAAAEETDDSRAFMTAEGILEFARSADLADVEETLQKQIECNLSIAKEGMSKRYGAGVGDALEQSFPACVCTKACAMAAAGSDARMNGCEMPVVINSGSGNQGITVSVPVLVYAKELGSSREETLRALLISNLMAIYIKTGIGCLSAYCGAVSAGASAGAGIAYLMGGSDEQIKNTLSNALAVTSGILCDGAKSSCAAKIAASVNTGILSCQMARMGRVYRSGDGLVAPTVDETIANIAEIARDGMAGTNQEIIRIMTAGC